MFTIYIHRLRAYILGQDGNKASGFVPFSDAVAQTGGSKWPTSDVAALTEDVVYNCGVMTTVLGS
ncbi:hypothetical protein [Peterkaempfera griseoplana]|uniref:hypothetical protein n=1 Tax=Peterkaempfera griseoplana TaxID=66896 RepID=UPI0012FF3B5F|nr:hypothetical protein [Peterkaempfera griseoplana]